MKTLLLLSVATLAMVSSAMAADNGIYIGGGVGKSMLNFAKVPGINYDEKSSPVKAFVGYNMSKHSAVELQYADLGTFSAGTQYAKADVKLKSISIASVSKYPIGDFTPMFKMGIHKTTGDITATGGSVQKIEKTGMLLGVGIEYSITDNMSVRAEAERYNIGYYDVDSMDIVTASLIYNF